MENETRIIRTLPGAEDFALFEGLVDQLYEKGSPRFNLGHDPIDQHLEGCYILLKDGLPQGRYTFYENPELYYLRDSVACMGSYECVPDIKVAKTMIKHAKKLAKAKGHDWLIGPMEGSTWNNYRFSDHNSQPNFFMEPYHHTYYKSHFRGCGFNAIASYTSHLKEGLDFDEQWIAAFEKDLSRKGARFRNLDMENLESDLLRIAEFSIEAFSGNFLYSPIDPEDFVAKYLSLKTYFTPELVLIIEDAQREIQALSFSIKDFQDPTGQSVIIKSMAKKTNSPFNGVGKYLAEKTYQVASELGYTKAIHALMHEENSSAHISKKDFTGDPYKTYSLYGLRL